MGSSLACRHLLLTSLHFTFISVYCVIDIITIACKELNGHVYFHIKI